MARCTDAACTEAREWLAYATTALVILGGLYQYWRSQQWQRAEFLAAEMRTFLDAPTVKNALVMIDWSDRYVNLFGDDDEQTKWPYVTRKIQSRALLPHVVDAVGGDDAAAVRDSGARGFDLTDAAIRDTYDTFLDGLERFASYVATGLIDAKDLRPYLRYWIDDIASVTSDAADMEWTACLLAYMEYYGFVGVQRLFQEFGHDVRSDGRLFQVALGHVTVANREDLARVLGEKGQG